MSLALLELAVDALGPLVDDAMFLGGASLALWISDPAAPPPRPTKDVDVVVEIASLLEYERFSVRMRERGFAEDIQSGVICRWRHKTFDLLLDAMPSNPRILGFSNRWQAAALPHAAWRRLPSGARLRSITPPFLLATKLEAFGNRGRGDMLGSRDFADIVALVDGRGELPAEIAEAPYEIMAYLAEQVTLLLALPRIADGIAGGLRPDDASQARAGLVVLPRLRRIATGTEHDRLRRDLDELLDSSL